MATARQLVLTIFVIKRFLVLIANLCRKDICRLGADGVFIGRDR
jgi:hypothetical protein